MVACRVKHGVYDEDTVIVGHSAGGPLLLSILENLTIQIAKAILVSGFARQKKNGKNQKNITTKI